MNNINKESFKDVSLHNMKWEKQTLENIIAEKKNELEEKSLNKTLNILNSWIADNEKPSEREINILLNDFMKTIRNIEREV